MARIAEEQIDRLQLLTQKNINDLAAFDNSISVAQADISTLQTAVTADAAALATHAAALTWTAVSTFKNSWVNYGGGAVEAQYAKDAHGFVHIIGRIKSGTIGSAAFTLPEAYRPAEVRVFACSSNADYGQLNVQAEGDVVPAVGNNASFYMIASYYVG